MSLDDPYGRAASPPHLDDFSPPSYPNAQASSSALPTPPVFVTATLPPEPLQDLGLPPHADYDSLESLVDAINAFGRTAGYAVSQRSTNKAPADSEWAGRIVRGTIVCVKGGKHRENHKYLKESGRMRSSQAYTRKSDCPFALRMALDKSTRRFRYTVECGQHNHGYLHPSLFPVHRRVDEATLEWIKDEYRNGRRTTALLPDLLERDPRALITYRDLENIRAAVGREERGFGGGGALGEADHVGDAKTSELIDELDKKDLLYRIWNQNDGAQLGGLVASHPVAMAMANRYGHVLVMETINLGSQPESAQLILVRSTSPTGHLFPVASCYLLHPHDPSSHAMAIETLVQLLPHLPTGAIVTSDSDESGHVRRACQRVRPSWRHLIDRASAEENVRAGCESMPSTEADAFVEDWKRVTASSSVVAFEAAIVNMRAHWSGHTSSPLAHYLRRLESDDHALVRCFTDEVLHFGTTGVFGLDERFGMDLRELAVGRPSEWVDPERSIGVHGGGIDTAAGAWNLVAAIEIVRRHNDAAIELALDAMAEDSDDERKDLALPAFATLRSHISRFALDKIASEYTIARSSSLQAALSHTSCTDRISSTLGLPCSHALLPLLSAPQSSRDTSLIPLEWTHAHWRVCTRGTLEMEGKVMADEWAANTLPTSQVDSHLDHSSGEAAGAGSITNAARTKGPKRATKSTSGTRKAVTRRSKTGSRASVPRGSRSSERGDPLERYRRGQTGEVVTAYDEPGMAYDPELSVLREVGEQTYHGQVRPTQGTNTEAFDGTSSLAEGVLPEYQHFNQARMHGPARGHDENEWAK